MDWFGIVGFDIWCSAAANGELQRGGDASGEDQFLCLG